MKRFHVHVSVDDLEANVRFYSTVFGTPPTVLKPDYVKWMVDDPRVNFAISQRGLKPGVDHLGVQVESETGPRCASKWQRPRLPRSTSRIRNAATPVPTNIG